MRNLIWQARFLTYYMSYGPSLDMRLFMLSNTPGSGSDGPSSPPLKSWLTEQLNKLGTWISGTLQRWSPQPRAYLARYGRPVGSHRGSGRASRSSTRALREIRLDQMETAKAFQELRADSSLVGVAHHVPGARAYRRLAMTELRKHDALVRSRYYPGEPT